MLLKTNFFFCFIQPRKLSISGIKKRTKSDIECEEYICPMDSEVPQLLHSLLPTRTRKNDNSSRQGVEISEKDQQSNNKVNNTHMYV